MNWKEELGKLARAEAVIELGIARIRYRLIAVTIAGIVASLAGAAVPFFEMLRPSASIQQRAEQLSKSLTDATTLIDQMQADIQSRQAMVTKLQSDLETYNKLATLKKDEVEAVAQVLRGEIDRNSRRSFWEGVAVNFTFFILGAVVSWFVGRRQVKRSVAAVG
jgi:uncharacterized membrane protein YdfJ with MMPL/SSD domain